MVRTRLDEAAFDAAYRKGQTMTRSEAIAFALSENAQ
jgi:hypothetical protein